jgi:hypothetical protein
MYPSILLKDSAFKKTVLQDYFSLNQKNIKKWILRDYPKKSIK